MALVNQSIPNLYGGVSQQGAVNRPINQLELAENCWFSLAEGVSKRPPLEVLRTLSSDVTTDDFWGWHQHDSGEWILINIPGDGSYRGFRVSTGNQLSLTGTTTGISYLTCTGKASDVFKMVNADGNLLILNTEVQAQLAAGDTAGTLAGTVDNLQSTDLDDVAPNSIWQINGTQENPFSSYYVKKVGTSWVEWVRPEIPHIIDAATMPHKIDVFVDEANPELFELEWSQPTWDNREVGDQDTNEAPSFIGRQIRNMFFLADRLVFVSGDSISMSAVGKYFRFWRTTVTDVLDDNRIDVSAKNDDVIQIDSIVPVSGQYVVIGSDRQYVLEGSPALTPSTVNLKPVTRYPAKSMVAPQAAGPNVYFAASAGDWTHVREMFIQEDTVTLDASNASAHTFAYVPKDIRQMEIHPDYQTLVIVGDPNVNPGKMWVYQYHWVGTDKIMSAWNTWVFPRDIEILNVQIVDHYLAVVYREPSGDTFLGQMDFNPGNSTPEFPFKVHYDFVIKPTGNYNSASDATFYTLPFPIANDIWLVDGTDDGSYGYATKLDSVVGYSQTTSHQFRLNGDTSSRALYFGVPYNKRVRLSEQFFKQDNTSVLNSRVQIRNMQLHFTDTGYFRVYIDARGRDPQEVHVIPQLRSTYTARTLNDEWFMTNKPQLSKGTFDFPVLSKASDAIIELRNDSHIPSNFQAAEWRGLVSRRHGR